MDTMDLRLSEKERRFRNEIREFVRENLPPPHFDHMYSEEHDDESWAFSLSISKKLAAKRWLTLSWPRKYGGLDASPAEKLIFGEEAGYWGIPGHKMGIGGTVWVGPTLMILGTEEQKKRHLPLIASGQANGVWCTGYSEPDSGSDLASLQTRADRRGNEYIVNGQKVWTSAAHRARWLWLACRTRQDVRKKHHGLSILIVDMKSDGISVRPIKNYVGYHFFNEIFLKDVRVPAENLVGIENNGWKHLMQALNFERGSAVYDSGLARRLGDELLCHARTTGLYESANIRRKIADLFMRIEAARVLAYQALWQMGKGQDVTYEASRDKANMDMLFHRLGEVGMEALGGYSMLDPLEKQTSWSRLKGMVEHIYYTSPGKATAAGSTFTQRNIVGQFGLGLPRSY